LIPGQRRKLGKKEILSGQLLKEKQAKPHAQLLKIRCKVKLMKIFFAKSDRLKAPSPFQVHSDFEGKIRPELLLKIFIPFVPVGINFFLNPGEPDA